MFSTISINMDTIELKFDLNIDTGNNIPNTPALVFEILDSYIKNIPNQKEYKDKLLIVAKDICQK